MTSYGVRIVDDQALPDCVSWAFARCTDGTMTLVLSRTAANSEECLAEAWEAYRLMSADPNAVHVEPVSRAGAVEVDPLVS